MIRRFETTVISLNMNYEEIMVINNEKKETPDILEISICLIYIYLNIKRCI